MEQRLRVSINPKKTILQPVDRGVDFVGQLIKPWRRTLRPRTVRTALRRCAELPAEQLHELPEGCPRSDEASPRRRMTDHTAALLMDAAEALEFEASGTLAVTKIRDGVYRDNPLTRNAFRYQEIARTLRDVSAQYATTHLLDKKPARALAKLMRERDAAIGERDKAIDALHWSNDILRSHGMFRAPGSAALVSKHLRRRRQQAAKPPRRTEG